MAWSKENNRILFGTGLLILIALILYAQAIFSGKPLGLDALGHLSKVSYLKQFPTANWDMAWYGGAPFLKFYSPLFYYLVFLFPNSILGANLIVFLSVVLTSVGIFLLVYNYNKNFIASLISGTLFLTVLNTSYYFIVVGNHPFVLAFWTVPFTILFLEKSLKNKLFLIPYCLVFLMSILSHIFITFCLIPTIALRLIIFEGINKRSLRNICIFIIPPIILSFFWLLPFLTHSSNYVGDDLGYIPSLDHLLGFGDYNIWGKAPGEIGIAFFVFIMSFIAFLWSDNLRKDKNSLYFLSVCGLFFLLMDGLLGKYNPTGIGAVRYVVLLSIFLCVFIGLTLGRIKFKNKLIFFVLLVLIVLGLWANYKTINENYNNYSYNGPGSRYYFIQQVLENEKIPLSNNFTNYRFGTTRFVFSETLNFFYPAQSQTFGYYDQGILYPEVLFLMRDSIWRSDDLNSTLFFLDWFGIKYFEIGGEDLKHKSKFQDDYLFREVEKMRVADYPFTLYEYRRASPILSVLRTNVIAVETSNTESIKDLASTDRDSKNIVQLITQDNIDISNVYASLNYNVKRDHPDKLEIYSEEIEEGDIILFKEFYHTSWKAKELPSKRELKVYRTSLNSMAVLPSPETNKVIFYQSKNHIEVLGIVLSIISFISIVLWTIRPSLILWKD
ncbi:MAG: hypothetical protein Q8Q31_03590 [Nanoarchaeota archaeon]|nr:hypothetical protein [Nanoarchaeota archaeon]